jgi:hypothetical protein
MPITGRTFRGFSLLLGLVPLGAQSPETTLKIEVNLYNYSRVSAAELARAEQEAARIYGRLGIAMEWRTCPFTAEELAQNTNCDLPAAPTRFTLRLLSNEMAQRFPVHSDIYGFALLSLNGGFGVTANVFADRAREMAARGESEGVFLGHLIAHELGHLLLDEAGHPAGTGIMHTPWQTKELEQIKQGVMFFLPGQTEKIRAQVLVRNGGASFATRAIAGDLKLTVVIYNHAHVKEETLLAAESTTSAIFARAGVQLVWREGFAYAAERRRSLIPYPEDPATLIVKLRPESEAARYGVRSVCGGLGLTSGAIVFVRNFDSIWLGYVMAHELGHILLGANAHSVAGVMRGTLLQEDWGKAAQGTLGFTRSQHHKIRAWIVGRREHATEAQLPHR